MWRVHPTNTKNNERTFLPSFLSLLLSFVLSETHQFTGVTDFNKILAHRIGPEFIVLLKIITKGFRFSKNILFNCKHSLEFTVPYQYTYKAAKLNIAKNIFFLNMKHAHTPRMKDYIEEKIFAAIYATRLLRKILNLFFCIILFL